MKKSVETIIIDRIEGGIAVAEAKGEMIELPLADLPCGVKEGSVLVLKDGAYVLDKASEEERKKELFKKQKSLFSK